jgi:trehalose 2-sulfotransferase
MSLPFASFVLCGTPRSGSTLLCEMLTATGVAGRPNSYFRREDIAEWAERFGVRMPRDIDGPDPEFDRAYVAGMRDFGTAGTGVFGLRLMWGSVGEATRRLNRALGRERDTIDSLSDAFGSPLFVHVSRNDKLAQAISRVRAEQSGLWHVAADGTVLEGDEVPRPVAYDGARIAELIAELHADDAAWGAFFEKRRIAALRLVYESVTADPPAALARFLAALGRDPDIASRIRIPTVKMADAVSLEWMERFRREGRAK